MRKKNLSSTLLLLLFLFLFIVVYYGLPLKGGLAYYSTDTSNYNYTVLRDYTNELRSGEFSLWEPSVFLGNYRAASPVLGLYSPRLIFYFILEGYAAQTASLFYLFLVSGLGAFLLGLSITNDRAAALFMGVVYSCSGFIASMHFNIPYLSAAWFPWVFWSYENLRAGKGRGWLMAVFLAMIAVEGDIIGCFITLGCLWAFLILDPRGLRERSNTAGTLLITSFLVPLLVAIILVPALEVMAESRRGAAIPYDMATIYSMHPMRVLNLAAPALWGEYYNDSFWGGHLTSSLFEPHFWSESIYLGLVPLICIGKAVMDRGARPSIRAPLFLAVIFLVLAFGKYTALYALAYKVVPGVDRFRYPAKLYAWASFFLVWCSAVGFARLSSGSIPPEKNKTWPVGAAAFFIVSLAVVLGYAFLNANLSDNPPENIDRFFHLLRRDALRLGLAATLIPLLLLMRNKTPGLASFVPSGLIILTLLDLAFAAPYYSRISKDLLDRPSNAGLVLSYETGGRLLRPKDIERYCPGGPRASLKHCWGLLEGLDYALGYGPTVPQRFDPIAGDNFFPRFRPLARVMAIQQEISSAHPAVIEVRDLHKKGVLDLDMTFKQDNLVLLSVRDKHPRFLVARKVAWAGSMEQALEMVLQDNAGTVVLEKQESFLDGRPVQPAPDLTENLEDAAGPKEELQINRPENDLIEVEADLRSPALLVVREGTGKGWKAWVNEKPAVIYRADYFGAAVEMPAGKVRVRLRFSPQGYRTGVSISALALVSLLVWIGLSSRRRAKRPENNQGTL